MSSEQKTQLIKYFKSLGIEVYTNTKARGHQGFFLKNRIDISKNTCEERIVPTLLHEFAHFIHEKLEPDMVKTGGSFEVLFDLSGMENGKWKMENVIPHNEQSECIAGTEKPPIPQQVRYDTNINGSTNLLTIKKELLAVTYFVDEHSLCHKLHEHKEQIKKKIKAQENIIKKYYPKFMRSKKFKEFDKYIKKSKAKYLLRYDRVKFVSQCFLGLMKKYEILSIDNLEHDFPDMPTAFCAYIRLKSLQKKQARISAKINKLNKYYSKPTELFARLVECVYIDGAQAHALAPHTTQRFFELLENGYYFELKNVFEMLQKQNFLATF